MAAEYIIWPAIIMGGIIGLIELFFVHADEAGMGWLSHGLHALPFTIFFVFISMNLGYVHSLIGIPEGTMIDFGIRIAIGLVAMLKIGAAASIVPGARGVGEKLPHTIAIGALVVAAPYIWSYALAGIVGSYLPE